MKQDRTDWLNERRKGIGGSDVAAIVGLSPWVTALDIYEQKLGVVPPVEQTEAMYWGTLLEPAIRQAYSDRTGFAIEKPDKPFVHPKYSFMRANLDGIVINDNRIAEFKTASTSHGWGEPGTDEIPEYYLTQVQHYMAVTNKPVCDVALLVAGRDFSIYTVEADKELQEQLIEIEAEFHLLLLKEAGYCSGLDVKSTPLGYEPDFWSPRLTNKGCDLLDISRAPRLFNKVKEVVQKSGVPLTTFTMQQIVHESIEALLWEYSKERLKEKESFKRGK